MKKLLLTVIGILALTSCLTTKGEVETTFVPGEAYDLFSLGEWGVNVDEYGSTYECADDVIVDGEINVDFVMTKLVDENYPDVELGAESPVAFTGGTSLTITYKSDKKVLVRLNQTDFLGEEDGGDDSYALYYATLPKSEEYSTVTVNFVDFIQPDWAEAPSTDVAMNLENVSSIGIAPALNENKGGAASLQVSGLILQ